MTQRHGTIYILVGTNGCVRCSNVCGKIKIGVEQFSEEIHWQFITEARTTRFLVQRVIKYVIIE